MLRAFLAEIHIHFKKFLLEFTDILNVITRLYNVNYGMEYPKDSIKTLQ